MKKISFNEMKLASKTAMIIGISLFVMFTLFIVITIGLTKSALTETIDSEFNNMSEKNAVKVQAPFDDATIMAENLVRYTETMYSEYENLPVTDVKRTEKEISDVYAKPMERFNKEMEDYYINTIVSTVLSSDDISASGIMFEPYAYDPAIKDYTVYISASDTSTYQSLGTYDDYKDELYYKIASETKKPYFTPPYLFEGSVMISATYPILYNGELKGVITVDINCSNFSRIATTDERYPTMYSTIYTNDGTIVYDSEDASGENVGKNTSEWITNQNDLDVILSSFKNTVPFEILTKNDQGRQIYRYYYPITVGETNWWALTALDKSDKEEAIINTVFWLIILAIISLVVIIMFTVFTLRKMINPISKVVDAAESIAAGNFNIDLKATSQDEIGILTIAFGNTAKILKVVISDISRVLNEMASGNLDVEPTAQYVGDLKVIEDSTNRIVENLNDVMLHIKESSEQVSGGSSQIANGAQALAEGATDQASSIQELQATVTDITGQVDRNADSAKEANELAQVAGHELEQGNLQMKKMLEAMEEISSASNEIKNVIITIEDIAEQTNLLSLNASIEAARAGDAGRGFAVVADQVGKLASESAEATKITSSLIEAALRAVENGKAIADETARSIDNSVGKVQEVVSNVEQISAASVSQSAALDQVSQGVEQISCVIEENSAMSEESASAAEELSAQAQVLDELVGKFKLK